MWVHSDQETCVGAGLCLASVPDVFDLDDDRKVVVVGEHPGEDLRNAVTNAV
jgi:ferredoxin